MQPKLLRILACPKCLGRLSCHAAGTDLQGDIISGTLHCSRCQKDYRIEDGIPRFVTDEDYSRSFGFQWNIFRSLQIDSLNGTKLSEKRFFSETSWTREWMAGKWILDVGCGAGRFLDVASKADCEVIGLDNSNAVDAAKLNLGGRKNVHLVQASIYELPFITGAFDGCYCIGVIQHTPDPIKALRCLPRILKEGGRLAVTIYERKQWTLLSPKYIVRPIVRRLNKELFISVLKAAMPLVFPLTDVLFRLPKIGRLFRALIPVANYVDLSELTRRQRYGWAILDTFDMFSPTYDKPQTQQDVEDALSAETVGELKRLTNPGINMVGRKHHAEKSV